MGTGLLIKSAGRRTCAEHARRADKNESLYPGLHRGHGQVLRQADIRAPEFSLRIVASLLQYMRARREMNDCLSTRKRCGEFLCTKHRSGDRDQPVAPGEQFRPELTAKKSGGAGQRYDSHGALALPLRTERIAAS